MKRLLLFTIFLIFSIQAKVLIFTYAYNRPDFIEIQHKLFQKFLKDEYQFVVFNDASGHQMEQSIRTMCNKLDIRCIRIPQEIHTRPYLPRLPQEGYQAPAVRNCNVVQYSLNEYGFNHDDILVLMDSDLFLVREFSFRNYLNNYDLAGIKQGMGYLWIGFMILNIPNLPNIATFNVNCGRVNNIPVDAGGHSYHYLHDNPDIKAKYFAQSYPRHFNSDELLKKHFDQTAINFILSKPPNIEYMLDLCFLHYRGGTNWDHQSGAYHTNKTAILQKYVQELIHS